MKKFLLILVLGLSSLLHAQSQIDQFQVLQLGQQPSTPANPPVGSAYIYFSSSGTAVCVKSNGTSCFGGGGSGSVTSIATTSPITGGTITTTGTIACATCAIGPGTSTANHLAKFSGTDGITLADGGAIPAGTVTSIATTSPVGGGTITGTGTLTCTTCVVASSPGIGIAHFAGSTQTVTSSLIVAADITSATITTTQLASSATPAMVQLETHAASTSATLDFTTCISGTTYHEYNFKFRNLIPTTDNVSLQMLVSTDGGGTYHGASGDYAWGKLNSNPGASSTSGSNSDTAVTLTNATVRNTASAGGASGWMQMEDPLNGAHDTHFLFDTEYFDTAPNMFHFTGSGIYKAVTAVNAVRFLFSSGTLTSGTITCYGVTP